MAELTSLARVISYAGVWMALESPASRRIRITLAYDGTEFHGWQVQPGLSTIQGALEDIVSEIEGARVHVAGSGRTDAGVHALAQVAAFNLTNPIPPENLQKAINRWLPPSVRILHVEETRPDFHPRFDAVAKTYRYTLYRGEICPPLESRFLHHHPYKLDEEKMAQSALCFIGTHDFGVFAAKDDHLVERSKVRTIFNSDLTREGDYLRYTVRGNGFLKHMVRNLVGTLIEAGRGNVPCDLIPHRSGATVPARGLTMVSVEY
ncbi:MAG TPA: tRNA pseudouridine(38-40) synthase TruA [Bryobacteraceae bacterium]|nr:tRNA pseudouridine(38-40) synthase TruA [Bryobacteraceae bacterium]